MTTKECPCESRTSHQKSVIKEKNKDASKKCSICEEQYKIHEGCAKKYWNKSYSTKKKSNKAPNFSETKFLKNSFIYYCDSFFDKENKKCQCGKEHNAGETRGNPKIIICVGSNPNHLVLDVKFMYENICSYFK